VRAVRPSFARPGDALLDWRWVVDRFAAVRSTWLGTTRPDGRPYAAPVWVVVVDGIFWFWTSATSTKGRNLEADPRLVLHLASVDDVAILEGRAVAETPTGAVVAEYVEKYGEPPPVEPSFWRVEPSSALAWRGHAGAVQVEATRFVV
jgi:hypothetical protein